MLRLLIVTLLVSINLLAHTEVTSIIGGGGSGSYGSGNINGVGANAAVTRPKAVAKSHDNQLLVGDKYGLKKVNIQTNTISTLYAFKNATFHDIEVDSSGNIYAGVTLFIDDPRSCNGSDSSFSDSRAYKFSSTGKVLEIWGSACENSNVDFDTFPVHLAIDDADNVYVMSSWTPEKNNRFGTKSTIRKLNNDGTISDYLDVSFESNHIQSIQDIEYNNGKFYIATLGASLFVLSPPSKDLKRVYYYNDNGPQGIEFDENNNIYIAYGSLYEGIQKGFFHNDSLYLSNLAGIGSYSPRVKILPTDIRLNNSKVDALDVGFFGIFKMVKIGNEIFFSENYYHRILKLTFPSNKFPTIEMVDFPTETKKNVYLNFKFNAVDSDGFISRVLCDFGDGQGKESIFKSVTRDNSRAVLENGSDTIRKTVRYTKDGQYTISCQAYDNEWQGSQVVTKTFTIGTVTAPPATTPPTNNETFNNTVWEQKDKYNPNYPPETQSDGTIFIPFAPWTNGKLGTDGYYDGNSIVTKNRYNLKGEKIQMKFSLNGAQYYTTAFIGISDLVTSLPYQYLSTDHQWGPTKLVDDNREIYYEMIINKDGSYKLSYSYIGYGQSDIYLDTGTLSAEELSASENAYIHFTHGDNYGGTDANATLYEFKVESIQSTIEEENNDDLDDSDDKKKSGGGAFGYLLPLFILSLLLFRKEE